MAARVQAVAVHQDFGGEDVDDVEQSTVTGHYDWRAYLREELRLRTPLPLPDPEDDA